MNRNASTATIYGTLRMAGEANAVIRQISLEAIGSELIRRRRERHQRRSA